MVGIPAREELAERLGYLRAGNKVPLCTYDPLPLCVVSVLGVVEGE